MSDETRVVNFDGFSKMQVIGDDLVVVIPGFGEFAGVDLDSVRGVITERIESGKQPSAALVKQLERAAQHVEHTGDAMLRILEMHQRMVATTPQKRTGAAERARRQLVEDMPDKVLKGMAEIYMDVSEYILPDDRQELVETLLKAMSEKAKEETEQAVAAAV